jgi:hypothetical protein
MSLIEIACPRCPHHGCVAAARLPGIVKCSACGLEHSVRDGGYVVRSYDAERLNGAPTGKPKRPQSGPYKRILIHRSLSIEENARFEGLSKRENDPVDLPRMRLRTPGTKDALLADGKQIEGSRKSNGHEAVAESLN